ncbi:ATP-binding protein [Leptolyngbya sp. PCC 6406]|uniref:ATP-binding protein n=1 Tax=Leptolyngbya sp. PCC 6406 TaxID=1173264 RepID=UPI0002AC7C4A|nr:anti-sigma regulatory factor [Leptolyngbya sp. PCC 6406]
MTLTIVKQSSFRTQTDLDALKAVLVWFDEFQSLPIPKATWLQCQLALIEGFTNAVRHAHDGMPPETPIEIEAIATTEALNINIWDQGPGFDFNATLRRKLETTNPDSEGGRGLRIMRRIADSVEYECYGGRRNCLHIHKQFKTALVKDGPLGSS